MRPVWRLVWSLTFVLLLAVGAAAQETPPDYDAWHSVASRAETAIENARASDQAFISLRAEVAEWRLQFQAQLNANNSRIQTLNEQLTALGSPPEEGATEASEITERRAELNAQLIRLNTPRRTAEEAFRRANGIISEIDQILRQRQADDLLKMGPWPVNPSLWREAAREINRSLTATVAGMRQAWNNPITQAQTRDNLPLVIALILVGIGLLARSRHWSELLATRFYRTETRAGAGVAAFFVSLGQIILPMIGLLALARAIDATGLLGLRGEIILAELESMGLSIFVSLWIASRIFPGDDAVPTPVGLTLEHRFEGRVYTFVLGAMYALFLLFSEVSSYERFREETDAVLHFPLIVVASLILLRLGWVLRQSHLDVEVDDESDRAFAARIIRGLGQAAVSVAFIAPLLATTGYGTAAKALVFPSILTLGLAATIFILQQLVRDIFSVAFPGEDPSDSLIPTLVGLVLVFFSTLPLALIWGVRDTEISELWTRLQAGVTVGETTISPTTFLTLIIVFGIGYVLTRGVQSAMKSTVLPKTKMDPGGQTAIVSGLGYVGITLASLAAVAAAGLDLSNLAIVAGALSVGIGFGLQNIVSNFVSGIILLIERPISEGDWIEVGGQMGYVRKVSVRSTLIETFDRTDVIVPNADLVSGTVTNYTRGNTVGRVIIPVGVAYGTDTRKVEGILREIAEAHPMALANPAPTILFAGFGADSLEFEVRIILRDVNWVLSVRNDINHQIAARFAEEGIEIPFAQRDVWLRNPEALVRQPTQEGDDDADITPPDAEGKPA